MSERRVRRLLRLSEGRDRVGAEMDEEVAFHLQQRVEQLVARGLSPEDARAEALARFGPIELATQRLRESAVQRERRREGRERAGMLRRDLAYSIRSLRRSPVFAAAAIVTLALGIGANSAVAGLIRAVLLRTPPYTAPSRLVMVWERLPALGGSGDRLGASLPEFVDYRDRNRVFSAMAGFENNELDLTGDGPPERLAAAEVTSNLFATLGVRPVLGRDFTAADGQEGAGKVAILSYPLWQSRFGGDASVVGRVVRLNEESFTVVGVMPRGFEFPWPGMPLSDKADLWTPLVFTRAALAARAESYDVRMVARLAPGVTLDHARADLTRIVDGFREEYPQIYAGNVQTQTMVDGLVADARADARPLLLALAGAVVVVLLIACANAAHLLLARAVSRRPEVALRRALGAGAGHVVGQALIEALVLAAVGAGVGIGLAAALVGIIRRFGPDNIAGLAQARIDGHVLAFTAVLALVTALVCGVVPALRSAKSDAGETLRSGRRDVGGGRGRQKLRSALVVFEAASAMVLVVSASLLVRSLIHVLEVPPGFDPDGVVVARTTFDYHRYASDDKRRTAERTILERLRALPGAQAVGLTTHLPIADEREIGFTVDGRDPNEFHWAANALVGDDYFRVMRIPLLRGRTFGAADVPSAPWSAVINESMARHYWPNGDAVGRVVRWGGRPLTIVGVVGDVRVGGLDAPVQPTIYGSVFQLESGATQFAVFIVRTASDPQSLLDAMRRTIWSVDGGLPVYGRTTLGDVVSRSVATRRFLVWLLTGFAIAALALAVVGLYGVLSYAVVQRTPELGVRVALGARPGDVSRLVVRDGLRLAGGGIAIGAIAAAGAGAALARLLFGVGPFDVVAYAVAAGVLAGASLLACWIPARRAARLDPLTALRAE
ncbi:MAG TPA: ABC transporter permease [Gemmatimonadaceae bacterium]|nr:ABC transporter permease [Gemmatimonadaceae bacterium]